jgi:diacylglycerol kinase family enzyme
MSTEVAGSLITETRFFRHAKELAKEIDLSQFDGVVCVSGDGVLVEVCFPSACHSLPIELVSCIAFILVGILFHVIY